MEKRKQKEEEEESDEGQVSIEASKKELFNYPKALAIDENLLCPICSDPCVEPVVEPGCGQMFCKACLTDWLNRQHTCPHCRRGQDASTLVQPPRFIMNALNALLVICPTCAGHLERKDLRDHISKCPVDCKLGCGEKVAPVDLEAHEETTCREKVIPCPAADVGCQQMVPRGTLDDHTASCQLLASRPLLLRIQDLEAQINSLRSERKDLEDRHHAEMDEMRNALKELENNHDLKLKRELDLTKRNIESKINFLCKALKDKLHSQTCAYAAEGGHLEVLKWARENGFPWDEWACAYAAQGGHLDVLKWLRENGCPWNEWTCAYAALGGHLEVLQWLRENGCPWNAGTCVRAAEGGHLDVLKWAIEHGCPGMDKYVCAAAAKGGHLDVLQWLRENGCPWDADTCANAAQSNGHSDVVKWLESQ